MIDENLPLISVRIALNSQVEELELRNASILWSSKLSVCV